LQVRRCGCSSPPPAVLRTAHGGIVGIWLGYRFGEEESRPEQAHHDKFSEVSQVEMTPQHTTNAAEELRCPCDALPLLRVN